MAGCRKLAVAAIHDHFYRPLWGSSLQMIFHCLIHEIRVRDYEEKSRLRRLREHLCTNKPSLEDLEELRGLLRESQRTGYFEQQLIQAALDEVGEEERKIIEYRRRIDEAKKAAEENARQAKEAPRPSEPFRVDPALLEFAEKQRQASPGRRVKFDWKQKANRSSFKSVAEWWSLRRRRKAWEEGVLGGTAAAAPVRARRETREGDGMVTPPPIDPTVSLTVIILHRIHSGVNNDGGLELKVDDDFCLVTESSSNGRRRARRKAAVLLILPLLGRR
ncbi:hypothetical protein Tsubulata_041687 [Turnera subulata]|uniref:Uncharacterized protein n=1 Tax=Turnera subulata TaxID=218843 RepID=A0A9Q0G6R1_9ROSI|nr:hypothetical protein Tsubulata_041687 [Turnera subulata]